MSTLVLASRSPRRLQLLEQLGVQCRVRSADIDESQLSGENAEDYVVRLARQKCDASALLESGSAAVLAADTCVVLDDLILGKPRDHFDGLAMLARLSGREHRVLTAVCLKHEGHYHQCMSETGVQFLALTREQCEAYLKTDEPWDKAGGYGIQGLAGAFVERIDGSYSSVVGLPLAQTWQLLQAAGIATALESPDHE
jgi:septum formation protein